MGRRFPINIWVKVRKIPLSKTLMKNQIRTTNVRKGIVPKQGRPKGSTKLSKEKILRRLASRPKVTFSPRVQAVSTRKTREDPHPLGSIDIASLIKDPTYPEPTVLETDDLGTKAKT
jgi:hypothetical protein